MKLQILIFKGNGDICNIYEMDYNTKSGGVSTRVLTYIEKARIESIEVDGHVELIWKE